MREAWRPIAPPAPLDRDAGLVARRSWQLVLDAHGPLLAGLFGFPWRERMLQAKCTKTEAAGPAELFGTVRVDRLHRSVPSPDCTCGIYATEQPDSGWLVRRYLRDRVIVSGFVRLYGKLVTAGPVVRAERAEIVGPLTISLPGRHWLRRLGAPAGVNQTARRVVREVDGYAVRYSDGGDGVSVGEWYRQVGDALGRRYGVAVVGVLPGIPGLDAQ